MRLRDGTLLHLRTAIFRYRIWPIAFLFTAGLFAFSSLNAQKTGSSLRIRVENSGGKPVAAAIVLRRLGGSTTIQRTTDDGQLFLESLEAGKYQLVACGDGLAPELRNIRVSVGHTTNLRVRLKTPSSSSNESGCNAVHLQ